VESTLWSIAGILFAGAITPGANNFVVLHQAARAGWRRALPAMIGVLTGGIALLILISTGVGALLTAEPRLAKVLGVLGCLYLGFLGCRMMVPRSAHGEKSEGSFPQASTWSLFTFQVLNPKSWLLLVTVSITAQGQLGSMPALPALIVLFAVISAACLSLWSWLGIGFHHLMASPSAQLYLDRVLGLLLMGCALALLVATWR
jgi:threonine/homoserine/homoserine lactone efflux protein